MQTKPSHRILIIDDHQLFNNGLHELLSKQPDLMVCGQVFQANDALRVIQQTSPHLILLDVNLQGINGIDLGKSILTGYPATRILVLTMYDHRRLVEETRRAGLHGYLLKDTTTPDLLHAIHELLDGRVYFDPRMLPKTETKDAFGDEFIGRVNLTFRETEIISLIRKGLTTEQIAEHTHLSVDTVKTHRKNIHGKLKINKVTELIDFAIRHGI